jgi:hypothetical protein
VGLTGVPTTFYIRAKDKYGNLRTSGGDAYVVRFQGPCGVDQDTGAEYSSCANASSTNLAARGEPEPAHLPNVRTHIFDLGDGSYLASYVLTAGGTYAMAVKLHGLHIRGSPFQVTASPDAAVLAAATGATFAGALGSLPVAPSLARSLASSLLGSLARSLSPSLPPSRSLSLSLTAPPSQAPTSARAVPRPCLITWVRGSTSSTWSTCQT